MRQETECKPCYFLMKTPHPREWPNGEAYFCWRTGEYLEEILTCLTGILVSLPKDSEEFMKLLEVVEGNWRKDGEGEHN